MENRISVKFKSPNPLFEKWLTEWRDKAKEKNLKTQHAYSLALASLRKYPLPLERGKDCKILKGFGTKVCDMLDEALANYKTQTNEQNAPVSANKKPRKSNTPKEFQQQSVDSDSECDYLPTYMSGPFAILFALYRKSLDNNYKGFLTKKELIEEAQPFCDTSFTKPKVGSFYTSWNSMKTLISKKLVHKEGNPAKFSLTNKGVLVGCKLYTRGQNSDDEAMPSTSSGEKDTLETYCSEKVDVYSSKDNCVILSDSEDEEPKNIHCAIPEQSSSISNELKELCGVFNNGNNEKNNYLSENSNENGVKNGVKDSTASNVKKGKPMKNKNLINENPEYEDYIMAPFSFDVLLFVDTQETSGRQIDTKHDAILNELERLNVKYEVRNLKVGDYCWVCRDKVTGKELIAPYIIERKRMDDLASSIKDGRFHEQKFRIKQCGLKNIIYMVESYGTKDEHVGLPLSSLNQAIVNTLIQDGFIVKIVEGLRGLAEYLSCMSNLIRESYEKKTIVSCPKENISDISFSDDLVSLMYFAEFNKLSSRTKNFNVKEMFIRQLLQIKGLSVEKALAIVEVYPTPKLLKDMIIENERKSVNIISNIKFGKLGKKIGPLLSENLYMFYTKTSF